MINPAALILQPGQTGTITAQYFNVTAGAAITAVSNNTAVATVFGSGNTPGPISFNVIANTNAVGSCQITFNVAGNAAVSGEVVQVLIVPVNATVATGLTAQQAILKVRRRTNLNFGQPSDFDITQMLNDGLRRVARYLEPIISNSFLPIVSANTSMLVLPADVARIRDAQFATQNPSQPGTIVYEMAQLDYDSFIEFTNATPVGGIGGIPSIYTIIQDASGLLLIQFYPFSSSGYVNLHYYKRPLLWTTSASSTTDLDEMWEEAVITYACAQACENREDESGMKKYRILHKEELEDARLESKRRLHKWGSAVVRDVSVGEPIWPQWAH